MITGLICFRFRAYRRFRPVDDRREAGNETQVTSPHRAGVMSVTLGIAAASAGQASPSLAGNASAPAASVAISRGAAGPPGRRRPGGRAWTSAPPGRSAIGTLGAATRIEVDVVLAPSSDGTCGLRGERLLAGKRALPPLPDRRPVRRDVRPHRLGRISTVEASLRAEGLTPGTLSADHLTLPVPPRRSSSPRRSRLASTSTSSLAAGPPSRTPRRPCSRSRRPVRLGCRRP